MLVNIKRMISHRLISLFLFISTDSCLPTLTVTIPLSSTTETPSTTEIITSTVSEATTESDNTCCSSSGL
ncbi:hypothetical protein CRE_27444 [Caenorhabditis remanei]|uniref:Uncharacterized protein n=1 Tax=Caenorhabditis remanei TaxID=31234 RepID=E3LNN0_CAERE|nr:hypothetical protein CRE_27444 [Caenorhabditis remanei]